MTSSALLSARSDDYFWMAKAIKLARRGRFSTSPNPQVGCVILDSNNNLAGQGFHRQAGTPHAEIHALREAGSKAAGGTAYVTLEPCSHFGRTPPCADALISANITRVIIAMTDPNPQVSGRGIKKLQEAGITVLTDVMASESAALNRGFIKRMVTGKPWITVKLGTSLDGKIALSNGESQWITGSESRRDVQRFRAASCAVLTGAGTALSDNPSLLVRANEAQFCDYPLVNIRQPLRIVIDSHNRLPNDLQLFTDGYSTIRAVGETVESMPSTPFLAVDTSGAHLDLSRLVQRLGEQQLNSIWVESGPGLAGALLEAGEVDELIVYQAPVLLGNKARSMVDLPDFSRLEQTKKLQLQDVRQLGDDIRMTYRIR